MAKDHLGKGISIRDVAQEAGVAPSTVSRVLNNQTGGVRISPATAERVRVAAAQLRYRPNASARSLRTTQTQTIGVIAFDLLHPFIAGLLNVIYATCQPRGYHILVGNAQPSSREGWILGDILSPDRVDGILVIGEFLHEPGGQKDMEHFVEMHRYIVSVSGRPSVTGEPSIMVDNATGVRLAVDYLATLGHRHIGFLGQKRATVSWEDGQRYDSYRRCLASHGLPPNPQYEAWTYNEVEPAQDILRAFMALPQRPTAIVVNNDTTAIVALKAASSLGIRIPTDLSIIGFDDITYSALYTPGLTTIHQPIDEIGNHAATALLNMISSQSTDNSTTRDDATVMFQPRLVCRESCAAPF